MKGWLTRHRDVCFYCSLSVIDFVEFIDFFLLYVVILLNMVVNFDMYFLSKLFIDCVMGFFFT